MRNKISGSVCTDAAWVRAHKQRCQNMSILALDMYLGSALHMATSSKDGTPKRREPQQMPMCIQGHAPYLQHVSSRVGNQEPTANKFLTPSLSGTLYWETMPQAGMRA